MGLLLCSLLQATVAGSEGSEGSDEEESEKDDSSSDSEEDDDDDGKKAEEEEENEPLSLEWPETRGKQATFLFLLPIVFPLWLTLPDVRNPVSPSLRGNFLNMCSFFSILFNQLNR